MKKTKTFFDKLPKIIKDKLINYFDDIDGGFEFRSSMNEILRGHFTTPDGIITFLKHYKLYDKEMEEAIFPFVFAEKDQNEKV